MVMVRGDRVGLGLGALLCLSLAACGEPPPPASPELTPPSSASAAPPAVTSAPASAAASSAPASAAASSAPAAPLNAEAIMASVPEKAGVIQTDSGMKITIDAKGGVTIDDPKGKSSGSSSCGFNGFEYRRSVRLFAELQDALRAGAKEKVAELVNYPLRVNEAPKKHTPFKDRAALLARFEAAFSDKVVREILAADPRAIFCRADGFMLGSGVVWAEVQKGHYGVFVING